MCHETWTKSEGQPKPEEVGSITLPDGTTMPAWTYRPAEPKATCIVLPDIYGPSPFYHYVTAQLAAAGYEATLVEYFVREGALAEKSREAAFARRAQMTGGDGLLSTVRRWRTQFASTGFVMTVRETARTPIVVLLTMRFRCQTRVVCDRQRDESTFHLGSSEERDGSSAVPSSASPR
jgi:hypothetical protein